MSLQRAQVGVATCTAWCLVDDWSFNVIPSMIIIQVAVDVYSCRLCELLGNAWFFTRYS